MNGNRRKAVVVGGSSGIGAACVGELVRRGYDVAVLARRADLLERVRAAADPDGKGRVHTQPHDVLRTGEIPGAFTDAVERLGGGDLFLYAAGVMPRITPDTWDFEKDRQVIDVNLTGLIAWSDCVAPYLASAGGGHLAAISSIAGDRGRRGYPAYNASKAGMDTFLEALRNRLSRRGVKVTTIKPGFIDTGMTKGMEGLFWLKSADEAARMTIDAIEGGARVRYVPRRWALVGLVIRNIPSFIFKRMDI